MNRQLTALRATNKVILLYRLLYESPQFKVGFLILALLMIVLFKRELVFFVIFSIITAVITYFRYFYQLPFDIGPLLFFQVIIAKYYNFMWMVVFVFLAYMVPKTLSGGSIRWQSYFIVGSSLFLVMFSLQFQGFPIQIIGLIAALLVTIPAVLINLTQNSFIISLMMGIPSLINNIIWFFFLGNFVTSLFSTL